MARTQKYPEDLLLEAVVRYSEKSHGKIKATELAAWSRSNVKGLEEVRDYHFIRPVMERDAKSGKTTERRKLCAVRIEEINRTRSLAVRVRENLLLRAPTIEAFMAQPDCVQRGQIAQTRETVDRLLSRNEYLTRENESIKAENKALKAEIEALSESVEALLKTQNRLSRQITHLMKTADEADRKAMLADMGLEDGSVDLDAYAKSLRNEMNRIADMRKALRRYLQEKADSGLDKSADDDAGLADAILSGIDFSGGV